MVKVLKKFGPAVQDEDKKKQSSRLQEERLKNVETEEWFTDEIVPHMEEHVSNCGNMNHFAKKMSRAVTRKEA